MTANELISKIARQMAWSRQEGFKPTLLLIGCGDWARIEAEMTHRDWLFSGHAGRPKTMFLGLEVREKNDQHPNCFEIGR